MSLLLHPDVFSAAVAVAAAAAAAAATQWFAALSHFVSASFVFYCLYFSPCVKRHGNSVPLLWQQLQQQVRQYCSSSCTSNCSSNSSRTNDLAPMPAAEFIFRLLFSPVRPTGSALRPAAAGGAPPAAETSSSSSTAEAAWVAGQHICSF